MIRRTNERTIIGLIYRRLLSLTPACCLYFKAYIMPIVGDIPCLITTDKHRDMESSMVPCYYAIVFHCWLILGIFFISYFVFLFHTTDFNLYCVYCRRIYLYVRDWFSSIRVYSFPSLSLLRLDNMISYIIVSSL